MMKRLLFAFFLLLPAVLSAETQVITYVVTTQQQREDTRWTLTEWLRIKERMKMMDVWLAMFSEPEKDKFAPEFNVFYGALNGTSKVTGVNQTGAAPADLSKITDQSAEGRMQLWLTNLVSGALGVRTLNIDFGIETYLRMFSVDVPDMVLASNSKMPSNSVTAYTSKPYLRYNSANLRLFGKNIQDSSLVLKFGEYASESYLPGLFNTGPQEMNFSNRMLGVELQLYLFRWLGLEGNYLAFNSASKGAFSAAGQAIEYGAYVEISLLRLMGGFFQDNWVYGETDLNAHIHEVNKGMYAGLKLQF
jgi:hypothetical protein